MSLESSTSTDLILKIALRQQPLVSIAITDHFLSRANLPPILQVSNQQVLVQKPTNFEKKTASESAKVNLRTQYYRCHEYEHLATQCLSQTRPS